MAHAAGAVGLIVIVLELAFLVAVISAIVAIFQIRATTHQIADSLAEILRRLDGK